MLGYIVKRLVLMGVTLFGVSLVLFLIIALMPGRPSGSTGGAEAAESSTGEALSTDFERKWRANYHLNKPTALNWRPWMERAVVEGLLQQRLDGITPEARFQGRDPDSSERAVQKMRAEHALDDLGEQGVTHLVAVAADAELPVHMRAMAIKRLPLNAERFKRVRAQGWTSEDPEYQAYQAWNAEVAEERAVMRSHGLRKTDLDDPDLDAHVEKEAAWWVSFYDDRRDRYELDTLEKVGVLLFDTRYGHYIGGLLTGDLGKSMNDKRVSDEILDRLPLTMTLNAVAFFFIYLLALPVGIYAAVRRGQVFDIASTVILFMLYSLPTFYVGLMMVAGLTDETFRDLAGYAFPVGDWDSGLAYADMTTWGRFWDRAEHSILPLICMIYGALAGLSRFARTGMLDIIESDYIRTARAKGLSEYVVVLKHALRNGALPVLTLMATILPAMIGGSVIIEVIFNLRGMGLLLIEAISSQDYMIMAGIVMTSSVLVVVGMFIVDVLYTVVDPRISFQ